MVVVVVGVRFAVVARQQFACKKISKENKMAAATARQIPVVNNVITDEDFEKLRTEGKVRKYLMQRGYLVGKHSEITCCFYSILANLFQSAFSKHTNFLQTSTR